MPARRQLEGKQSEIGNEHKRFPPIDHRAPTRICELTENEHGRRRRVRSDAGSVYIGRQNVDLAGEQYTRFNSYLELSRKDDIIERIESLIFHSRQLPSG